MDELVESLIVRYLSGTATPGELQQLEAWINRSAENSELLKEYQATWALQGTRTRVDFDTTSELRKLERALDVEAAHQTKSVRWVGVYRVAASVAVVAICSFVLYRTLTAVETITRESGSTPITFSLPDGSTISMNKQTKVTYRSDFDGERHIQLEGEAYFDVVRNPTHPFVIQAANSTVEVLGTSFSFKANKADQRDEVFVVSGKVSLADHKDHKIILTKGQQGVHDGILDIVKQVENVDPNLLAWKSKRLVFQKTPLIEVARTLEEYFDIVIQIKNPELEQCRFTSSFNQPSLVDVIETLSIALRLDVVNQNRNYTFDGDRCNP